MFMEVILTGDERWAVYYTSTMRRELVPNKILLATRPHNGQYSSYFSIIVNSNSGTLSTRASFPFIPLLFFVTSLERIVLYFCFYFHSLYLFASFFLCVLASFHQSNFSDLVFTFFLFRFPFLFFYLSLFLLYFYYNSSQDCESLLLFCILRSNSLPSKIHCLVEMKWE